MRSPRLPAVVSVALALVLFAPEVLFAQYAISTVAGGGPNDLTALSASIGYPGSVVLDTNGNTYIADRNSNHIFVVNMGTAAITIETMGRLMKNLDMRGCHQTQEIEARSQKLE